MSQHTTRQLATAIAVAFVAAAATVGAIRYAQYSRDNRRREDAAVQPPKLERLPSLADFTRATAKVIEGEGIDKLLPTVVIDGAIQTLNAAPKADHCEALQAAIQRKGYNNKEFLFAVRSGEREVTTGHFKPGAVEFMTIREADGALRIAPRAHCPWWRLGP